MYISSTRKMHKLDVGRSTIASVVPYHIDCKRSSNILSEVISQVKQQDSESLIPFLRKVETKSTHLSMAISFKDLEHHEVINNILFPPSQSKCRVTNSKQN